MGTPADATLSSLDAVERGCVLGALLLGTAVDAGAAASRPPPSRERCAAALAALGALPRAERLRLTGGMAREAMAPLPAGLEAVPPEPLAAALDGAAQLGRRRAEAEGEGLGAADLLLAIAQRLPVAVGLTLLDAADAHREERAAASRPPREVPPAPSTPHRR